MTLPLPVAHEKGLGLPLRSKPPVNAAQCVTVGRDRHPTVFEGLQHMPRESTSAPAAVAAPPKTMTNWKNFEGLVPETIRSQGYLHDPKVPYSDLRPTKDHGHHSLMKLDAATLLRDIDRQDDRGEGYGGSFAVKLRERKTDETPWPGWQQLAEAGVEMLDMRLAYNSLFGAAIISQPFHPTLLQRLLGAFPDVNGRIDDKNRGWAFMTLSRVPSAMPTVEQLASSLR